MVLCDCFEEVHCIPLCLSGNEAANSEIRFDHFDTLILPSGRIDALPNFYSLANDPHWATEFGVG
jgi:hypothetical protein